MKRFVIISNSQVSSVNFNEVMENNVNTLRYNLDGTQTFVKFTGDVPSFVTSETVYSEDEFKEVVNNYDNGWEVDPELEEEI